jgi:hypothetical protein
MGYTFYDVFLKNSKTQQSFMLKCTNGKSSAQVRYINGTISNILSDQTTTPTPTPTIPSPKPPQPIPTPVNMTTIAPTTTQIPQWVHNNAKWWSQGTVGDNDFVQGIQYLIEQKIIVIPQTTQSSSQSTNQIPAWIKNNAGWWANGQISDNEFVKGIQYLVQQGIIKVS